MEPAAGAGIRPFVFRRLTPRPSPLLLLLLSWPTLLFRFLLAPLFFRSPAAFPLRPAVPQLLHRHDHSRLLIALSLRVHLLYASPPPLSRWNCSPHQGQHGGHDTRSKGEEQNAAALQHTPEESTQGSNQQSNQENKCNQEGNQGCNLQRYKQLQPGGFGAKGTSYQYAGLGKHLPQAARSIHPHSIQVVWMEPTEKGVNKCTHPCASTRPARPIHTEAV